MEVEINKENEGQAPENNLPTWKECERIVDTPKETHLHRFIYEYDDANPSGSDWFLHRLELVIKEAQESAKKKTK